MQCEVRAMSETNTRSGPAKTSDTLPKPGRVTEVCKEWIVHEDGALAYRLQKEEVEQHLTGNKSRNAIVRQDFPRARDEQRREEEEAIAQYHQMVVEQEERDALVARQLALRIQREEEERRRRVELHDTRVARQMQEKELRRQNHVSPPPPPLPPVTPHPLPPTHLPVGDVNSVGLPDVSELAAAQFRSLSVREEWPPPPPQQLQEEGEGEEFNEEEYRRAQELRDEELARLLQQQEERLGGKELDQLDRDRLMAIEAQDKELAKLLQERERAKARRARERAKQKALLRKQQEAAAAEEEIGADTPFTPPPHVFPHPHPHTDQETSPRHRHRYPDPEAIEVLSPEESPLPNIAMAIDPTYSPHSTLSSPYQELEEYDEGPVPPYMPIQGQRRTSSLEKKKKKQPKDGCKQQ